MTSLLQGAIALTVCQQPINSDARLSHQLLHRFKQLVLKRNTQMWNAVGVALTPALSLGSKLAPKISSQPCVLPKAPKPIKPTPIPDLDAALTRLNQEKGSWARQSCKQRAQLLKECMWKCVQDTSELARLGSEAKGSWGSGTGEEATNVVPAVFGFAEYIQALDANGAPAPIATSEREGGQVVAQVFPKGIVGALFPGFKGEVWIQPGKPATQGALYRAKTGGSAGEGCVSVVLGAGNQISVVVLDVLHKMVVEDAVVLVKMSPVNEYAGPVLERIFAPLVTRGWLAFCYGGREVGEHVCRHPLVESVHLTGSAATFNSIVWGAPTAPAEGDPVLTKPVTAELGNITPFIIVPGPWSDDDLKFHARSVAAGLANNAAHNCIALELLVTAKEWPLRQKFLDEVKAALDAVPQRTPYYPGSCALYDKFEAKFKDGPGQVHKLGKPYTGPSKPEEAPRPWLLVEGLSPEQAAAQSENWSGVVQEVALPGSTDPESFMSAAAQYVNTQVWGSLAAAAWIHPDTLQQVGQAALESWIAQLRYGCISINAPPTMGYALTALPWGAAPGNTPRNVESGIGMVHNTYLFDHPQKGVVYVPWRPQPKPLWFMDNTSVEQLVPFVVRFIASLDNLPAALLWMTLAAGVAIRG